MNISRADFDKLARIGDAMANVCFSLGQYHDWHAIE